MRLFTIKNMGLFMTGLLSDKENIFDQFLLSEAVISTGNTYTIDGHINKDFYTLEDLEQLRHEAAENNRIFSEKLCRFESVKSYCFSIIKGKKAPLAFRISLCLSDENTLKFLKTADSNITADQINSLNFNIKYDGSNLTVTTAISYNIFTMDKSLDNAFDNMVARFLDAHGFDYE